MGQSLLVFSHRVRNVSKFEVRDVQWQFHDVREGGYPQKVVDFAVSFVEEGVRGSSRV